MSKVDPGCILDNPGLVLKEVEDICIVYQTEFDRNTFDKDMETELKVHRKAGKQHRKDVAVSLSKNNDLFAKLDIKLRPHRQCQDKA